MVFHKLVDGLKKDFLASKIEEEREVFVGQDIFVLAAFFVVLRREEVFKLVLGEIRAYFV